MNVSAPSPVTALLSTTPALTPGVQQWLQQNRSRPEAEMIARIVAGHVTQNRRSIASVLAEPGAITKTLCDHLDKNLKGPQAAAYKMLIASFVDVLAQAPTAPQTSLVREQRAVLAP